MAYLRRRTKVPARPPQNAYPIGIEEVMLAFALVARLDPENYKYPEAKALIALAVELMSEQPDEIIILPEGEQKK